MATKGGSGRTARRPARAKRRPAPAFAPAFAAQTSAASARELLLFELQRARVTLSAALQGMGAAAAAQPLGPGRWTSHEVVLHLIARDQARLDEFEAVRAGGPASWAELDAAGMAAVNEAHLAPLRRQSWDEALRRLQVTRERLMAALLAVPGEPAGVWDPAHPFGAMLRALPKHDRHHAEQIKLARISS
jgi:hypothetical protein